MLFNFFKKKDDEKTIKELEKIENLLNGFNKIFSKEMQELNAQIENAYKISPELKEAIDEAYVKTEFLVERLFPENERAKVMGITSALSEVLVLRAFNLGLKARKNKSKNK